MTWTVQDRPRPSSTKPRPTIDSFTPLLGVCDSSYCSRLAHLVFPTDRWLSPPSCFRCSRTKKNMKVSFVSSPRHSHCERHLAIKQEPFKMQKSANCLLGPPAFGQKTVWGFFFSKKSGNHVVRRAHATHQAGISGIPAQTMVVYRVHTTLERSVQKKREGEGRKGKNASRPRHPPTRRQAATRIVPSSLPGT